MARTDHTHARKEARRAHAATEFPQYPAATYTPRPYTTRISQPVKQDHNETSRQAARPHRNNNPFASHSQKAVSAGWSARRELSGTRSRRICNWVLAAVVVLGIILAIVLTLKKLDKSRHWRGLIDKEGVGVRLVVLTGDEEAMYLSCVERWPGASMDIMLNAGMLGTFLERSIGNYDKSLPSLFYISYKGTSCYP